MLRGGKDEAVEVSMFHFVAGVSEYQEYVELENSDSAGNEGCANGGVSVTCNGESWGEAMIWSVAVCMAKSKVKVELASSDSAVEEGNDEYENHDASSEE